MNIVVIGGGSWGTSIARLLYVKGFNINFYVRDEKIVDEINNNGRNSKYLKNIDLFGLKATNNLELAVSNTDVIVMAVPSHAYRDVLLKISPLLKNQVIVNLAKGFEGGSLKRISEVSKDVIDLPFVCLSGPSHAEEVALNIPTAVVAASDDLLAARKIQKIFSNECFRVYTNQDLIGVEIGGALKNIIALGAGMIDGLGYGDNTKAALLTRGIYEMSKLGIKLGANPHTFNGLTGIGDLIVTCTSIHSRNRRAGILIGEGKTVEEACSIVGQVVEGIKTTKSAYELSKKHDVSMPITEKLYSVVYNGFDPKEAVESLMTRDYKDEIEEIFLNNKFI